MLKKIKNTFLIGLMLCQTNAYAADKDRNNNSDHNSKEAYELGQMAMQSKDWRDAIEAFREAGKGRKLKTAANYWQAYAHYQVKQKAQAKRLLERLIRNHPDSQWVDDAKVLLFENGDGGEHASYQGALDEELKLFTLQQIMFNKPEKALPRVYQMLEESESERVKMNALQLLGMSNQDDVVDYLIRFVDREKSEELKHKAIQMLSLRYGEANRKKLANLYDRTQSRDLKAAIIQGFIHHDDNQELIRLLQHEKDEELSLALVQMLGIKGESAALKDMYKSAQGEKRRAILEALALSGDASYLYDVIDNETDQDIRNQAIHSLIMVDDENMGDYLAKLYSKADSDSEKDVIASVFIATDVEADVIIDILKNEDSTERKHSLLSTLMAMDSVEGLRQVYEFESDQETKAAIIRLLGAMDATDVLMGMYKNDSSLANNRSFFEAFGMSSERLNEDFLMDRFKAGNNEVKAGVLQAFLMQDNSDAMVRLLKDEQDHEVKKMIIKMIGITNPDALIDAIED
ncbi:MAG: HEAT repeat domain-containing protein [Marinicella sp.]